MSGYTAYPQVPTNSGIDEETLAAMQAGIQAQHDMTSLEPQIAQAQAMRDAQLSGGRSFGNVYQAANPLEMLAGVASQEQGRRSSNDLAAQANALRGNMAAGEQAGMMGELQQATAAQQYEQDVAGVDRINDEVDASTARLEKSIEQSNEEAIHKTSKRTGQLSVDANGVTRINGQPISPEEAAEWEVIPSSSSRGGGSKGYGANSVQAQKEYDRATEEIGRLEASVRKADTITDVLDALDPTQTSKGLGASFEGMMRNAFGKQTDLSLLRKDITKFINGDLVNNLPKGSASDADVALIQSGYPDATWDSAKLSEWFKALKRTQQRAAKRLQHKSDFIAREDNHRGAIGWQQESNKIFREEDLARWASLSVEALTRENLTKEDLDDLIEYKERMGEAG